MSFEPCQAMNTTDLHLVIGGKSLGKTKIMNTMVDQAGTLHCSTSACVSRSARKMYCNACRQTMEHEECASLAVRCRDDTSCYVCSFGSGRLQEGRGCGGWSGAGFFYLLNTKAPEDFVKAFVAAAVAGGQVPVIMIDEANLAFPTNGENGGANAAKREAASKALNTFVALTKEKREASVILIASDYAFPLGLEGLGLYKYDSLKSIVCPEVEEEPMLEVLKEWGLSQDLAKEWSTLHVSEFAFVSSGSLPKKGSSCG